MQPKNIDLIPGTSETHREALLILKLVYSSTTKIQGEKKVYSPHVGSFLNGFIFPLLPQPEDFVI